MKKKQNWFITIFTHKHTLTISIYLVGIIAGVLIAGQINEQTISNTQNKCIINQSINANHPEFNCCNKCGQANLLYFNYVNSKGGLFAADIEHCTCFNPSTKEPIQIW